MMVNSLGNERGYPGRKYTAAWPCTGRAGACAYSMHVCGDVPDFRGASGISLPRLHRVAAAKVAQYME